MRTFELTHQQNIEEIARKLSQQRRPVGYDSQKLKRLMLQKTQPQRLRMIAPGFTLVSGAGVMRTNAPGLMEPPLGNTPGDAPRSWAVGAAARSSDAGGSATPRHLRLWRLVQTNY